ncbi:hypothetical protein DFJ74DRAFT_759413 [Hyaloraphidium curvatum]|nr:hypothetical protein DFJ74DRAFT_759413 [Hyaloraphidium curvatum]
MSAPPPLTADQLSRYFSRIGLDAPAVAAAQRVPDVPAAPPPGSPSALLPTADLLKLILEKHSTAVPFENLDVHLPRLYPGRPEPAGQGGRREEQLLDARGGWCFEHNGLLKRALLALGYAVQDVGCRVCHPDPSNPGANLPGIAGHRALLVTPPPLSALLGNAPARGVPRKRYLADVGFGSHAAALVPVEMPERGEGLSPEAWKVPGVKGWRIAEGHYPDPKVKGEVGLGWYMQAWEVGKAEGGGADKRRGRWADAYWFDERYPVFECDFDAASLYLSTHPASPFVTATRISLWTPRAELDAILAARGLSPDLSGAADGPWLVTYVSGSIAVRSPEGELVELEKVDEGDKGKREEAWKVWFGIEV